MTKRKKICKILTEILLREVEDLKIFATVIILCSIVFSSANVYAEDFQYLQRKIILPDRIRHRHDSHKLTRPAPPKIAIPHKKVDEHTRAKYVQRQPKKPPRLQHPKLPIATSDHRGSKTPKRFGPPRFRR